LQRYHAGAFFALNAVVNICCFVLIKNDCLSPHFWTADFNRHIHAIQDFMGLGIHDDDDVWSGLLIT